MLRFVKSIKARFGWRREMAAVATLLPQDGRAPRMEDGLCNLKVTIRTSPGESNEVFFEVISGQRVTIDAATDGVAQIQMIADNDDGTRRILCSWLALAHQARRTFCDISVTGLYAVAIENRDDTDVRARLHVFCETNLDRSVEKKPPVRTTVRAVSGSERKRI